MADSMRERGQTALNQLSERQLPTVVRWLELLTAHDDNTAVEAEELWLLASGELEKMNDEIDEAELIDDWRAYLDTL